MPLRAIARTKIQLPALRGEWVPRARLDAPLARALETTRLTLLCAPAGFGKTAVLVRQLARLSPGTARAWIGADRDDDLPRLAACAVAALEPYDLPWRTSPEAIISALDGATAPRRREIAGDFINTLVATEVARGLIVIDDAHRIQDPTLFAFLEQVIERLPPHWGFVISTRIEPPIALARLRARGELVEFREDELRFTPDEVAALMQAARGDGLRESAARLLERTQGWAAGLVLALHSGHAGGAWNERHLLDYLASEVLAEAPSDLRRFLLRCSVLPELDPERCAAVSGDPDAARWLAEIERRGLFVTRRGTGGDAALVLHDLFRDCLADLLRREHGTELPELLRRAAASEPDTLRRVGLLLRANATAEAHRTVVEAGTEMLSSGAIGSLARLLDECQGGAERDAPDLDFLRGLVHGARWEFDAMARAMRRAAAGFARASQLRSRQSAEAHEALALSAAGAGGAQGAAFDLTQRLAAEPLDGRCEATLLRARIWQALNDGRLDEIAPLFERELALLECDAGFVDWYRATPITQFIGLPGVAPLIARWIRGAQRVDGGSASALSVLIGVMQAWLDLWAGRAEAAAALLETAAADAQWVDPSRTLSWPLNVCRAVERAVRGDLAGVLETLELALAALAADPRGPRREAATQMATLLRLRLAAACGGDASGRELDALQAALPPPTPGGRARAEHVLAAGWRAEHAGAHADALASWRTALGFDQRLRVLGLDVEAGLRFAAASVRTSGKPDRAGADALRPALLRARQSNEHLPALLAGPAILAPLAEADWDGMLDAGEQALLREWLDCATALRRQDRSAGTRPREAAHDDAGPAAAAGRSLQSRLSEREWEILARLAAGDSNKLIARAYDLSPHTVKRHVANILHKLDLCSRGQAAAWWRAHC